MDAAALAEGDTLTPRQVDDVRAADMKLVAALLEDPYPVHFDRRRADRLVNQAPANVAFILEPIVRELEQPSALRSFDIDFHDIVFEGETVTVSATVTDRQEDADGPILTFAVELTKPDDTVAVDGTVTAEFPRRRRRAGD